MAYPASPQLSLGASLIQEVVKEEGEEGEGVDDPAKLWFLPQPVGGAGLVAISSFTLVLPPTVATDKVACPPAFSILWNTSNKRVSSSPIFASESEE